tara:strand:- start:659 stop:937 length:279 start_codon:yes stop_codon:yes gene_type:complete
MTQHSEIVEQQRLLIAAEKWAVGVKSLHVHSSNSMHYDDRPEDTEGKSVTDIEYYGGWIERWQDNQHIHTFGKKMGRKELLEAYGRVQSDQR